MTGTERLEPSTFGLIKGIFILSLLLYFLPFYMVLSYYNVFLILLFFTIYNYFYFIILFSLLGKIWENIRLSYHLHYEYLLIIFIYHITLLLAKYIGLDYEYCAANYSYILLAFTARQGCGV